MMQEPQHRNLTSIETRRALGNRFKHVRMAQGKSAAALASSAGITEFELNMIEQGVYVGLNHDLVENIAFNLGLTPKPKKSTEKPKEVEIVKRKYKGRKSASSAEKAEKLSIAQQINKLRKQHNISAAALEREVGLPPSTISNIEYKQTGMTPERTKLIMDAIERLATSNGAAPVARRIDASQAPQIGVTVAQSGFGFAAAHKNTGFTVSTEHKITCGDYELLAAVNDNEFSLSLSTKEEIMILEGNKKDKRGILAALKYVISIIEK